jgi:hypothetical protein
VKGSVVKKVDAIEVCNSAKSKESFIVLGGLPCDEVSSSLAD